MNFDIDQAMSLLLRTPRILDVWLRDLPEEWVHGNDGGESWSPFDVVGHFIQGERKDWIPRVEIILSGAEPRQFVPFDRFAQFQRSQGKSLEELLDEFSALRKQNVRRLKELGLAAGDYPKRGLHPALGEVTLRQLLATWVVHDFNHLSQIAEVMARQYGHEVGPWIAYLDILRDRQKWEE